MLCGLSVMLAELQVRNLGVIKQATLLLGRGMTVVTGETGAGKTLIIDSISLLMGGKAEKSLVYPGADYAEVEGRFVISKTARDTHTYADSTDDTHAHGAHYTHTHSAQDTDDTHETEIVIRRVIPRKGRSRGYINGRIATIRELTDLGCSLVELHGQHVHQSLLMRSTQRALLDVFGEVDTTETMRLAQQLRKIVSRQEELGGDEQMRARELDLFRYQLAEILEAQIEDADEDVRLDASEKIFADAAAHHESAQVAVNLLNSDGNVVEGLRNALATLEGRELYAEHKERLINVEAEIADVCADIRVASEMIEDNPETLNKLRTRRHKLAQLRHKYGPSLQGVIKYGEKCAERVSELENLDERIAMLDEHKAVTEKLLAEEQRKVFEARLEAAPKLASAVQKYLRVLAMPNAQFDVRVSGEAGEDVVFNFSANPGYATQPLSQIASGGELARAMLALRLVLTSAPPTSIFDEVDAGIGGAAAYSVGQCLAAVTGQVLVVTHLAQVAVHGDCHFVVEKTSSSAGTDTGVSTSTGTSTITDTTANVSAGTSLSSVRELSSTDRVTEISRMLSGSPESETAKKHAEELLRMCHVSRDMC